MRRIFCPACLSESVAPGEDVPVEVWCTNTDEHQSGSYVRMLALPPGEFEKTDEKEKTR